MAAKAGGLYIAGDRAYCAVGWNGFYMIDIQRPSNPIVLARHKTVGQVYDLWIEGTCAFVAEGWEGLSIVDVSQPARTLSLGKVRTRGEAGTQTTLLSVPMGQGRSVTSGIGVRPGTRRYPSPVQPSPPLRCRC